MRVVLRSSATLREATVGDDDAVVALMCTYLKWVYAMLRERHGIELPAADASLIRDSLSGLRRPSAMIVLAERDGDVIGVGAVRGLDTQIAEIKRMYVSTEARGLHVGSDLLNRLIAESLDAGAERVRLDSAEFMTDAHRIYRSRGFVERPPYPGSEIPEAVQQHWLFFERAL